MVNSKLKALRLQSGLPIVAMSVRSGVGPGTIVAIEKHGHNPTQVTKEKLARALGCSVENVWPAGDQSDPPTAA